VLHEGDHKRERSQYQPCRDHDQVRPIRGARFRALDLRFVRVRVVEIGFMDPRVRLLAEKGKSDRPRGSRV
jgi:hypothetical protein